MSNTSMIRLLIIQLLFLSSITRVQAFDLVRNKQATPIVIDSNDNITVKTVAQLFINDIQLVSGTKPELIYQLPENKNYIIIAGTINSSKFIQQLIASGKLEVLAIEGQWERWICTTIENPFPGIESALVIAGSDRRGTAYGLLNISNEIGVNPWYWWADVPVKKLNTVVVEDTFYVSEKPAVQYRGIFLNDEDFGLYPWAAKNMDPELANIGPNTYSKIFELLLRLRANIVWPAMHHCTEAFYSVEGNKETADRYGILIGTSHCEPMGRNNVGEWDKRKNGKWDYINNKAGVQKYWEERVEETVSYENVFTIGMRGIHDENMPGGGTKNERTKRLEGIVADQRNMLSKYYKEGQYVPQILCAYNEVLDLYQNDMVLPDDITIVWADDNQGYMRQFSSPKEQLRSGGAGVYYHFSYWGNPKDWLWLSSISYGLIWNEMYKALTTNATRLWIFNVGDIKPAEKEIQFAMDYAWKGLSFKSEDIPVYMEKQFADYFGKDVAKRLVKVMQEYYSLAAAGKPEHIDKVYFSNNPASDKTMERINRYQALKDEVKDIKSELSPNALDAYFQLIEYPVYSAANMNFKHLYAEKADLSKGKERKEYNELSLEAYNEIKEMTLYYNTKLSKGKWSGMMHMRPMGHPTRNYRVYQKRPKKRKSNFINIIASVPAATTSEIFNNSSYTVKSIPFLGESGAGITLIPEEDWKVIGPQEEVMLTYKIDVPANNNFTLQVRTVPTHRIYDPFQLRYAVSINGDNFVEVNVNTASKNGSNVKGSEWATQILTGTVIKNFSFNSGHKESVEIRIKVLDPGLVFDRLLVIE